MSYGYPTSGGGGSGYGGGYGGDPTGGYGSGAYSASYAPPTTGYDATGCYATAAAGSSAPAASGAVAGPLYYAPTPPAAAQDPAEAQADIERAMQEGTHATAINYYSGRGRWLGTETATIDEPRDGQVQLPDQESHWTRHGVRVDVSPDYHGRNANSMRTRSYRTHNFDGPQGDIRGWAHYQGTDDNHLSTYDYQAHGEGQSPPRIDGQTRGRDRYASESLDRGRAPLGWANLGRTPWNHGL
ncbi:hypothetical protein PG997_010383 [Apiospora hydei]|uniref:Uncharacterized protein n=1 Tax=Apiospora hydei TaxID=1337664 RepID=A0ABR1VWT5_9PEZI